MMMNRNKRSIALDLKTEDAKNVIQRLAAVSDVLTRLNPGLIYCAITGYGRTGPYADKGGFDLIAQGFSGLMSITGERG